MNGSSNGPVSASVGLLLAVANQLLLAALPGLLLIAWLLLFARREVELRDPLLRLLAIAALSFQLFASTWNPELGAYQDWDLFAIAGVFLTLLGAAALTRLPGAEARAGRAALPVLLLCGVLTASWVTSNARRVVEVDALHDDAHYRSALRYERAGETEAAERELREALRVNPRNANAAMGLATLLRRDGREEEARRLLERLSSGSD